MNKQKTKSSSSPLEKKRSAPERLNYDYADNYSDYANNEGFRAYQDFSESALHTGPHFGKGPKGYRRSDERIYEEACEVLSLHPEIDATEMEVKVTEGLVTLSGTVESRHVKRLAESTVENLVGVHDVQNNLRIDTTLGSRGATHTQSAASSGRN
ncbi:MAG: BON domain-containing protein [Bdellovibrionaceae bacterium]|nr:BON domain-containing protein [Bdellovibrio sp.]